MSTPNTKEDIRNYIRTMASEIYSEQPQKTRDSIDKIGARIRNFRKKYDTVKREGSPVGRDQVRRHILGGATSVAEILDGEAGKKIQQKRNRQRKPKSRKSRVVK